jgi:hypothetical protein
MVEVYRMTDTLQMNLTTCLNKNVSTIENAEVRNILYAKGHIDSLL